MNTTDKLATALGQAPAPVKAPARVASKNPIINMLVSDRFKKQMALALPKSLTADRLTRIVLTEFRKTPALLSCDRESLFGAVLQCAALGLEPGSALGHCYLLPSVSLTFFTPLARPSLEKASTLRVLRSNTPLNSLPQPMGQFMG